MRDPFCLHIEGPSRSRFLRDPFVCTSRVPRGAGSFKAFQMLLLAFFTWEGLGFLQSFPQFAFGVLYLESLASFQSFACLERFASLESFEVPAKRPTICFWRSCLGSSLLARFQSFAILQRFASLETFGVPSKLPNVCFLRFLDSSLQAFKALQAW